MYIILCKIILCSESKKLVRSKKRSRYVTLPRPGAVNYVYWHILYFYAKKKRLVFRQWIIFISLEVMEVGRYKHLFTMITSRTKSFQRLSNRL